MLITKKVTPTYGVVGNEVTFSLKVLNDATYGITNVMVYDRLVDELLYVQGTLMVDGAMKEGSPEIGVSLGDMDAGAQRDVVFKAKVLSKGMGTVMNKGEGSYIYYNPITGLQEFVQVIGESITIQLLDPQLEVTKYQDKEQASVGETVNYTLNIYNSGDMNLLNVKITDALSKAMEVINESIRVNGKSNSNYDIAEGIIIPSILEGETVIITFAAVVKGCSCKNCITNQAAVKANYILPNGVLGEEVFLSNTTSLFVGLSCFKQIMINKELRIPECKPEIEEINDLTAQIIIEEAYTFDTIAGKSLEGQILTGQKLIINGILKVLLSYTALNVVQSVYVVEYEIPFGNYLVTPLACDVHDSFATIGVIEEIHYTEINSREVGISASVLLRAMVG